MGHLAWVTNQSSELGIQVPLLPLLSLSGPGHIPGLSPCAVAIVASCCLEESLAQSYVPMVGHLRGLLFQLTWRDASHQSLEFTVLKSLCGQAWRRRNHGVFLLLGRQCSTCWCFLFHLLGGCFISGWGYLQAVVIQIMFILSFLLM